MVDEPHEVVKLLIKRMDSHPEEFRIGKGIFDQRWSHHVDIVRDNGSEADKAALNAKMRDVLMDELHEQVMDELCNGEERRRKEREEQEYERNLAKSLQLTQQQAMQQQLQQYQNAVGQHGYAQAVGLAGQSPNITPIASSGTGATLASSVINQIKKALKRGE